MTTKQSDFLILNAIYLICMVVTSIVSFTIFNHAVVSVAFWINLIASYVAITAIWMYIRYIMRNLEQVKRFVPGYTALGVIAVIYLLCVVVYSLFTSTAHFALRWFTLVHIVTLALALILCGIIMIYIRNMHRQEADGQTKIVTLQLIDKALQQFLHTLENAPASTVDEERRYVSSLIELVRYSDPITPDSLTYNDHQILLDIELMNNELVNQYASGEGVNSERLSAQLSQLKHRLTERNQQLFASKS
ncbi:hypothetical protein [Paenibacillus xylanilyticus]|uniref:Uncharacterized protein n=1 Tax=Paenibacillus xylanilyticus TaxID=248903 RepID=A0A7Y6C2Z5_9BACL|nr:hypothetical protein [Paenibacillus xylanilyticus]NUU79566.1 hypothetical protein [Paenibacillus xylanilyticus]